MVKTLKRNPSFFFFYLVFLIFGAIVIGLYNQKEIYLWVNCHNNSFLDTLFYYMTSLGNGITLGIIAALFIFLNLRFTAALALAGITQGFLAQFLKKVVFPSYKRPTTFFEDINVLHIVKGVDIHSSYSFPSGHTSTAFCLFCMIALYFRKPLWGIWGFIFALLTGYSRIYLSQHFFIDVYGGAFLGISIALLFYWLFFLKEKPLFQNSRYLKFEHP